MEPSQLEEIARKVARQATGLDADDLRQDIWERWLRYPPNTFGHAWVIARNVRNTLWRRELVRRHPSFDAMLEDGIEFAAPTGETVHKVRLVNVLPKIRALPAHHRRMIWAAIMGIKMTGTERVRLWRARQRLKR